MNKLVIGFGVISWFVLKGILGFEVGGFGLWQLDIGQGDGALIRNGFGQVALIDAGVDGKMVQKVKKIVGENVRKIDIVVISHPHLDHYGGLKAILEEFEVKKIILPSVGNVSDDYKKTIEVATKNGAELYFVDGSFDLVMGNVAFDFLGPSDEFMKNAANLNNKSVAVRVVYDGFKILFVGDLEEEGEQKVIDADLDLRADVIKVGHHGSRTSSSVRFLERVGAKFGLISAGKGNKFKHPHEETLAKLQEMKLTVYRTDVDGDIEVKIGRDGLKVLNKSGS